MGIIVLAVAVLLVTAVVCGSVYVYRSYRAKKEAVQEKVKEAAKGKEAIDISGLAGLLNSIGINADGAEKENGENEEDEEEEEANAGGLAGLLNALGINTDGKDGAANAGGLGDLLNAVGINLGGNDAPALPTYPDWRGGSSLPALPPEATAPVASPTAAGGKPERTMGQLLPLRKGLRMIHALQNESGDYESIWEIQSLNDEGLLFNYTVGKSKPRPRMILMADLQSAREYEETMSPSFPATVPGTTAMGISIVTFNDLMTAGESEFIHQADGQLGTWSRGMTGTLGEIMGASGQAGKYNPAAEALAKSKEAQDSIKGLQDVGKINCTLKRADRTVYSFPVLLNNERAQLPAIRANCKPKIGNLADFYFLNDPQNPLALAWRMGDGSLMQVVKLEYTQTAPAQTSAAVKQLEQKLQKQEKVDIYGIYFDFASADLQAESDQTLDEIAAVMKANPNWKLNVGGHTDNIGGDASNMQLSKQRADAVKQALTTRYNISADRLTTAGYGASRPVESNDTMEGRARNRRVELSRM